MRPPYPNRRASRAAILSAFAWLALVLFALVAGAMSGCARPTPAPPAPVLPVEFRGTVYCPAGTQLVVRRRRDAAAPYASCDSTRGRP